MDLAGLKFNVTCMSGQVRHTRSVRFPFRFAPITCESQDNLPRIFGLTLIWTIRALETATFTKPIQTLLRNHMATWHHHWWILLRSLLFANWTYENCMENHASR